VELSATTTTPPGGMRGHATPAVLLLGLFDRPAVTGAGAVGHNRARHYCP
jgi:hypothetical protein